MIPKLYAIEVSGVCNMACDYCPYSKQQRARGLMTWKTVDRIVELLRSGDVTAHVPLFLHLFGEPLLHPDFFDMAAKIKSSWPAISFSTNCLALDYVAAEKISRLGVSWVTVSQHAPMAAAFATTLLKSRGVRVAEQAGPDHSWAGQVERANDWSGPCEFERDNMVVVRWNGDVATCCITDSAAGLVGSVYSKKILFGQLKPFSLCSTCHLKRKGEAGNGGDETVSV